MEIKYNECVIYLRGKKIHIKNKDISSCRA